MSPEGELWQQTKAEQYADLDVDIAFICGRQRN